MTVAWQATGDPAGPEASGDIVWSNAQQAGFMRFRGLVPNDPGVSQYQLWIFDAKRDEAHPIDGGVFDAHAGLKQTAKEIAKGNKAVLAAVLNAATSTIRV